VGCQILVAAAVFAKTMDEADCSDGGICGPVITVENLAVGDRCGFERNVNPRAPE